MAILAHYIGALAPKLGYFEEPSEEFAKVYMYFVWSLHFGQSFSASSMAVNRALCLFLSKADSKIPARVYVFCQTVLGSLFAVPILFARFYWSNINGSYLLIYTKVNFKHWYHLYAAAIMFVSTFVILGSYAVIIIKFKKIKSLVSQQEEIRRRQERSLHTVAFVICIIELCNNLFVFSRIGFDIPHETSFIIINMLQHVYCCASPYLLLIFSRSLRQSMYRSFTITSAITPQHNAADYIS